MSWYSSWTLSIPGVAALRDQPGAVVGWGGGVSVSPMCVTTWFLDGLGLTLRPVAESDECENIQVFRQSQHHLF